MFSSCGEFWFSCLCFHPNSQGKYFKSYCETKDSETFQCEMTVCLILYCFNKHVYKEEIFYSFIKCMHFIQFMPFLLTVTGTLPWRHTLYTVSSGAEWRPHALEKMYSGLQDTITEWHIQAMNHMKQHIMLGRSSSNTGMDFDTFQVITMFWTTPATNEFILFLNLL